MAQIEILDQGIVFSDEENKFGYCGWPTVCSDKSGTIYAGYSGFRTRHICPFGKAVVQKSTDGGKTWSAQIVAQDTKLDDRDISLVTLPDGRLYMGWLVNDFDYQARFNYNSFSTKDTLNEIDKMILSMLESCEKDLSVEEKKGGAYSVLSSDGGLTWTNKSRLPVYSPHGPCVLSDGSLLVLGRDYDRKVITAAISKDYCNWTTLGDVPFCEGTDGSCVYEPHVIELKDGRLLGIIRVDKKEYEPYTMVITYSNDKGKSWSVPTHTGIEGAPPHLFMTSDDVLVLSYGRRKLPYGERVSLSFDNGQTWEEHILLDNAESSDLGYGSTTELPDGSLFTIYYHRTSAEKKASIMYTKWRIKK